MRIVLDTGILIAALITVDTPPDLIYKAWKRKRFDLFTSEWQLEEFRRVSRYPKLKLYIKPVEAGQMINSIRFSAQVYSTLPEIDLCRDPDDNPILAIALEGNTFQFFLLRMDRSMLAHSIHVMFLISHYMLHQLPLASL